MRTDLRASQPIGRTAGATYADLLVQSAHQRVLRIFCWRNVCKRS